MIVSSHKGLNKFSVRTMICIVFVGRTSQLSGIAADFLVAATDFEMLVAATDFEMYS